MPVKSDREYRNMTIRAAELDEMEEGMLVEGYAATFNQPYLLWRDRDVEYWEAVDKDAFKDTDMSDVIMQYDHEGRVFARIKNETLSVKPDDHGLFIEANLGGTEIGRQLYEEIKGGYTNKMSFGFTVTGDNVSREEEDDKVVITRRITSVGKLFDVSAVSLPANDATEISVRSLREGVIEQIEAERLQHREMQLKRERLALRARAAAK